MSNALAVAVRRNGLIAGDVGALPPDRVKTDGTEPTRLDLRGRARGRGGRHE